MKSSVFYLIVLISGIMLGYSWCLWHEKAPIIYDISVISTEQNEEFMILCRKHGQINTIHCFQEWYYLNEEGKKCKLQ